MLKRIAVHVARDPACQGRVEAAMALATSHGASIVGIYVNEPLFIHGYAEAVVSPAVLGVERGLIADHRLRCEEKFRQWTSASSVQASWMVVDGHLEEKLPPAVRCCDLLIVSQADPDAHQSSIARYQLESVIMVTGRPVIVVPYVGASLAAITRVMVCWDGGREAARAVADADPFLANAKEIVVLSLDAQGGPGGNTMADLNDYLVAHGYAEARLVAGTAREVGAGNAIMSTAADHGSDLVVMGFYGHSRAREWALGGASRETLASMTAPILYSH